MKCFIVLLTTIFLPLSACKSSGDSADKMVGGLSIDSNNFISSGRIFSIGNNADDPVETGACSTTRVGPRHFISAGHCVRPQTIPIFFQSLRFPDDRQKFFDSENTIHEFKMPEGRALELNASSSSYVPAINLIENAEDWSLIVPKFTSDASIWLTEHQFFDKNFKVRKLGDPTSVKPEDTVMVAGLGYSKLNGNKISECLRDQYCSDLYDPELSGDFLDGKDQHYAFFKIKYSSDNPLGTFYAETKLKAVESPDKIEYFFEPPAANNSDPRGLIAKVDSGGPVMKNETEVVGIVSGYILAPRIPFSFWNTFAKFPKARLESRIEKPIIDYAPASATDGVFFYILGYKIDKLVTSLEFEDGTPAESFPIDPDCKGLGPDLYQKFQAAKLVRGSDYECYGKDKKDPPKPARGRIYPKDDGDGFDGGGGDSRIIPFNGIAGSVTCRVEMSNYDRIDSRLVPSAQQHSEVSETYSLIEQPNFRDLIIKKAKDTIDGIVNRPRESPADEIWGESCTGGTGNRIATGSMAQYEKEMADLKASLALPVESAGVVICSGGTVHSLISLYSIRIDKISCQ